MKINGKKINETYNQLIQKKILLLLLIGKKDKYNNDSTQEKISWLLKKK